LIRAHDVEIKIQSLRESEKETLQIAHKILLEGYRPKKPIRQLSFTNVEEAGRFLTPKRIELMRLIRNHEPESIYALAKLAGRKTANVSKDVKKLKELGLISLTKGKKRNRKVSKPSTEFDELRIRIPLTAK